MIYGMLGWRLGRIGMEGRIRGATKYLVLGMNFLAGRFSVLKDSGDIDGSSLDVRNSGRAFVVAEDFNFLRDSGDIGVIGASGIGRRNGSIYPFTSNWNNFPDTFHDYLPHVFKSTRRDFEQSGKSQLEMEGISSMQFFRHVLLTEALRVFESSICNKNLLTSGRRRRPWAWFDMDISMSKAEFQYHKTISGL